MSAPTPPQLAYEESLCQLGRGTPGWLQGSDAEGAWLGVSPVQCPLAHSPPHCLLSVLHVSDSPFRLRALPWWRWVCCAHRCLCRHSVMPRSRQKHTGPRGRRSRNGTRRRPWMGQPGRHCCVAGCREKLGRKEGTCGNEGMGSQ